MTNEGNENLLKILLNKQNESPGINKGTFYGTGVKQYTTFSTIDEQMSYGEYTIMQYSGYLYLFDKDGKKLLQSRIMSNNVEHHVKSFTIDNEGNFYAIGGPFNTADVYLFYLNNITIPNTQGEYELVVKKRYQLNPMLNELISNGYWGQYNWTINKSPYDSNFLITIDGNKYQSGIKNLAVVQYHVNFEGENNYKYLLKELPDQFGHTSSLFVSWGEDNATGTICDISSNDSLQTGTQADVTISKVTFDFSNNTINSQTITTVSNFISSVKAAKNASIVIDSDTIYLLIQTLDIEYQTNLYKYVSSLNLVYQTVGSSKKQYMYALYVNRQLFIAFINYQDNDSKYHISFLHLIGTTMTTYALGTTGSLYIFFIITNAFNLYNINVCGLTGVYVYGESVYNGQPYFSNESVTPETMTLYGAGSSTPIFSRNLYNVTKVGNVITSTVQIPFNFLNNQIIGEEKLKSKTNSTIDDSHEEITKNIYEELYINNIDSYKVYDQNNGSTYNQDSSLEITKNIFNSFENNYKITKYRINYADETHEDRDILATTITDNIGTIYIYLSLTKKAKTIQLYDENFTVPFIEIDVSSLELNQMYQIAQKIKVE